MGLVSKGPFTGSRLVVYDSITVEYKNKSFFQREQSFFLRFLVM